MRSVTCFLITLITLRESEVNRLSFFPVGENVSSSEEELKLFVTEEGVHLFDCPLLFNGIVHLGCGVPRVP